MNKIILATVAGASKLFMNLCCKVEAKGMEKLTECILNRPVNQPLITIMNHSSILDEPLIWGLLPMEILLNPSKLRWILGADEILFKNKLYSWFFTHGQTISIVRGNGIYQHGMNKALFKLNAGSWINIFPEGKVNQTDHLLRFKWGVARLIMECSVDPIIVPIYHKGKNIFILGLNEIMPENSHRIPRFGKVIKIRVGNPMSRSKLYNQITYQSIKTDEKRRIEISRFLHDQVHLLSQRI